MSAERGQRRAFESTLWSVVLRAREGTESQRRAALERLCSIYWPPLYAYLLSKRYSREDAQDAIQGFFAYLLTHDLVERAKSERGRFRDYLRAVLDRHLANERRKARAAKRGGGIAGLSLDFARADRTMPLDPSHVVTPEAAYARAWKGAVLEQAFDVLRREYEERGAEERFSAVCAYLSAEGERPAYATLAQRLGCSESEVTNLLHRARRRLAELIRETLRETVETESEVDEEVRDLFRPG